MSAPINVAYSGMSGTNDHEECSSRRVSFFRSHLDPVDDRTNASQMFDTRFTGILQGAIITDIQIRFDVDQVSTGTTLLTVPRGHASDAVTFTKVKFNRPAHARAEVFFSSLKLREVELV